MPFAPRLTRSFDGIRETEQLSDDIRSRISQGFSIETILKEYASESSLELRRQFWEIPFYFQELLGEVTNRYVRSGATRYDTLVREIVRSDYQQILFITLNYDLFLEKVFERLFSEKFQTMSSYCKKDRKWLLMKIHGSVNWGQRVLNQPQGVTSLQVFFSTHYSKDPKLDSKIEVLQGYSGENRFLQGVLLYPALAVPLGEAKRFVCPPDHVEASLSHLRGCTDFLFIGFSALDPDVLELLQVVTNVKKLLIVGRSRDSAKQIHERIGSAAPSLSAELLRDRLNPLYDAGFSSFVGSGQHKHFIWT